VKRRLARDIGDRAALRLYVAMLARLLRLLQAGRRFQVVIATAPDRARLSFARALPHVPQGPGDLGRRMDRAFRRFRSGRAVIVGSDIPDIALADFTAAFRALGRADAVFGPAEDGGYWLVGMSPRRPARPFANVRWSTAHALSDTLANFPGRRTAMLRMLRDVDTADDLLHLRQAMP
jgi:rSAM/selenodomain-associated transferase 1